MRTWRKLLATVALGAAVGGATAQPPAPSGVKTADPLRVADPLGAMIAGAKSAHGALRDYACTFTRQERVNGALGAEQVAELKYRANPYSVSVRFARPEAVAGASATFTAGKRLEQVKVRPVGAKGLDRFILVGQNDPQAKLDGLHPVTGYGVGTVIDRVAKVVATEKAMNNALEVHADDFQFAGKAVTRYEVLARRPHANRYAYRMLVYVDAQTKLPLRWEAYDAPRPGTTTGELVEAHSYTDLRANVGLGDAAFE
jgi:hypothetical protein